MSAVATRGGGSDVAGLDEEMDESNSRLSFSCSKRERSASVVDEDGDGLACHLVKP
jgi:hypothetical protein